MLHLPTHPKTKMSHLPRYVISPCQYTERAWATQEIQHWNWVPIKDITTLCHSCEASFTQRLLTAVRWGIEIGVSGEWMIAQIQRIGGEPDRP